MRVKGGNSIRDILLGQISMTTSIRIAMWLAIVMCGAAWAVSSDGAAAQATWQDTMLAALEKLGSSGLQDGFAPLESETMRGGGPAQHISVDVDGAKELYLFVTGCPDVKWGVADWADARLIAKDGTATEVGSSTNFTALLGRHEINLTLRSGLYQKLRIGERQFERGLNVQANSVLRVPLDGRWQRFEAWIGVDAWAGTNGTVRFSVVGPRTAARKRLWEIVARDFPQGIPRQQIAWEREDRIHEFDWSPGDWTGLARRYAQASSRVPALVERATKLAATVKDKAELEKIRELFYQSRELDSKVAAARSYAFEALRLATQDLQQSFPERYSKGREFLSRLSSLECSVRGALASFESDRLRDFETVAARVDDLETLKREALLANPLLDFDRLLVIKRKPLGEPRRSQWEGFGLGEYLGVPRQSSWANGTMPNIDKWTNEIATLSPVRSTGELRTLFAPPGTRLVTDVDLSFAADKLMFSMPDRNKHWQICEVGSDGNGFRQLTPSDQPDVHNYDSCYLPDGKILFLSTAPLQVCPATPA
jgi:hypothetical protein